MAHLFRWLGVTSQNDLPARHSTPTWLIRQRLDYYTSA